MICQTEFYFIFIFIYFELRSAHVLYFCVFLWRAYERIFTMSAYQAILRSAHAQPVFWFSGLLGTVGTLNVILFAEAPVNAEKKGAVPVGKLGAPLWPAAPQQSRWERTEGFGYPPTLVGEGGDDDDDDE